MECLSVTQSPILPSDPVYFDRLVSNARRYQNIVWKVPQNAIAIYFGQTKGIKGIRNNYEFRCSSGRRQTFLGSNHAEDSEPTYEDSKLTRAYTLQEVIDIWLDLRNGQ